jgi:hypothetical protein
MAPDFARDAEYEAAREHFATADIVVMKAGKLECYANAEAAKLRWKLKGKLVDLTKS